MLVLKPIQNRQNNGTSNANGTITKMVLVQTIIVAQQQIPNSPVKQFVLSRYKAGSDVPIDIKDPRTGSEASDPSHPTIANYEYVTGNLKDGILYHVYRSNTATNAGNNNQNQSTTTSGGQFKTENGKVYYIKDGKKVSGWQKNR